MNWVESDLIYLKNNYKIMTSTQIAKNLGKSRNNVTWKISVLGLHKLKEPIMSKDTWSDIEKGFIAGILEGEGTISLNKVWGGKSLRPVLHITNTDLHLLEFCQKIIGGIISKPCNNYGYGTKPVYNLYVHNRKNIFRVLQMIVPFLVSKKEVAENVLEFCKIRLEKNPEFGRGGQKMIYGNREYELFEKVRKFYGR